MENFSWCPFYNEFAHKLLEFKDNRSKLVEIIKKCKIESKNVDKINGIVDPFTVFSIFNGKISLETRINRISVFAKNLNIRRPVPTEFPGIPSVNNFSSRFYSDENKTNDIDNLWRLFEVALNYSDDRNDEFCEYFNKAITIPNNACAKISMGLFWINPEKFLNLDSCNVDYIHELTKEEIKTLPKIKTKLSGEEYLKIKDIIFDFLKDKGMNNFAEFSHKAWLYSQDNNTKKNILDKEKQNDAIWFPKNYSPEITVEKWIELLNNPDVFKKNCLEIMKRMLDFGGIATCKQLSEKYGESVNFYNSGSSYLAKRIHEKTNCPVLEENTENSRWWPILYVGRHNEDKTVSGSYIWKLRPELKEALEKVDLSGIKLYTNEPMDKIIVANVYSEQDFLSQVFITPEKYVSLVRMLKNKKNIILQGAPGVGKTFAARRLAYSIMGEKDDSRIEFVQFHQNYSYEDFVMGYKPNENGFKLEEGIFYKFCNEAQKYPDKKYFFIIDEINRGNMSKIFGELLMLIEKDYRGEKIKLAYSEIPFSVPENLHIIGMMNTADRSLAMIDYALRRRFSFFDMEPGFESDGFVDYQKNLNNSKLDNLVSELINLNQTIKDDKSLGKGFCIGHSYLCGEESCTDEWLQCIVAFDILPMLAEYWFDEPEKYEGWAKRLTDAVK